MLRVLLDTNVLCADYFLRGTSARLLLDSGKRRDIQILVPMVVFLEAVRRFGEDTHGLIRGMGGWRKKLSRVALDLTPFDSLRATLGIQADNYERYLKQVLLNGRAVLLPLPDISHERMLERVLARRKPVKADGRGYQDALIWESVLAEHPTDSDPIHFITDNWTDFAAAAEGDELASELIDDLRSIGSTEKSVRLYRHLNQFTDEHVKPQREILGPGGAPLPLGGISEASLKSTLSYFLEEYADTMVGSSVDAYQSELDLEDVEIAYASFTGDLTIQEAFQISEHEVGVAGEAEFDAGLSALHWAMTDPSPRGGPATSPDDNAIFENVLLGAKLRVEFEGTIDQTQEEVVEFRPAYSFAKTTGYGYTRTTPEVHPDQGQLWE